MKKIFLITIALLFINNVFSQDKYYTKNGNLVFEATVPSFEEIKAENNSVTAIINTETSEIAVLALMKAFRFEIALMEEHFNENYVESDTYPKATFSGKLINFKFSELTENTQEIELTGNLTIHNKTKEITTIALISALKNNIHLTTTFKVKPEDFDIKIPGIVKEKIAKEINIHADFNLTQK
jgi:polyisoprenoid-binding protein YceI